MSRRILEKAAEIKTDWTTEVEQLMKDSIGNLTRYGWGRTNEMVRRLKHADLNIQLDRLYADCLKTA